ncbi:MAG: transglutaminase family protein [Polyangiaceae bacterium]
MRVLLRHQTKYRYATPVALGPHIVRLRPAAHTRATVESYNLRLEPEPGVRWQQDPWGNRIARLTFLKDQRLQQLEIDVDLALDIRPVNPFDFFVDDRCETLPFEYPDGLDKELAPFLASPRGKLLDAFVKEQPAKGNFIDWLVALNMRVANRVQYLIRMDPGLQTSEETLTKNSGSCRDSAQLLHRRAARNGLAARFVSGYLIQLADEGTFWISQGVSRRRRSACVGRGVCPRRGMDWPRRHQWPDVRRGAHPVGLHREPRAGCPGDRHVGARRASLRAPHGGDSPRPRAAAAQAIHRRAVAAADGHREERG